jgi:HAD superfamily hydrolase (TIGR01450 family)
VRTLAADLDGTIYKGSTLLPKVKETYHVLQQLEINTIFITNNSSQTPEEIKTKLDTLLQDDVSLKNIITPLKVIKNVRKLINSKVYVYGSSSVKKYLEQFNEKIVSLQEAETVLIGRKDNIDTEEIKIIANSINNGKKAFCLNKDLTFPTEEGEKPGNGAVVKMLEELTNNQIESLGKPDNLFIDYLNRNGLIIDWLIGDRVDTDILLAKKLNVKSILVKTGVTNFMAINNANYIIKEFDEILDIIS